MENYQVYNEQNNYNNDNNDQNVKISIIGVGGGGGNAINLMKDSKIDGVRYIAINTDSQDLYSKSKAEIKIALGTHLGAGGKPEYARALANEMKNEIKNYLKGQDMIFITAGMGGGTGTGASPIIAEIAKELGILTVAVVTKPFKYEGPRRNRNAEEGISELRKHVDTLIVIPNDKLSDYKTASTKLKDVFGAPNEVLYRAVKGISDIIVHEGMMNIDFADVKAIMSEAGEATIGLGVAKEGEDPLIAVREAVQNPLLDRNIRGATKVLLNITTNEDYDYHLFEDMVNEVIKTSENEELDVMLGVIFENETRDTLVTVVATGFEDNQKSMADKLSLDSSTINKDEEIEVINFPKLD